MSQTQQLKIFQVYGKSDKGLIRPENQDAYTWFESVNGSVFVLCDGMGGIPDGKKAAKNTLIKIESFISEDWFDDEKQLIKETLDFANTELRKELGQVKTGIFPGTTVVLVLIRDNKVFYAHAGDSRIYYQTGKKMFQLTEDHSLYMKLLKEKKLSSEDAKTFPHKNVIYNAVGINEQIQAEINQKPIFPADNDTILLCSDGLTNELTDEEIIEILKTDTEIRKKGNLLINRAIKNGGEDNVTVLLIQFYNTGKKSGKNYRPNSEKKKKNLKRVAILGFIFLVVNAIFMFNYFFNKDVIKNAKSKNAVISYDLTFKTKGTKNEIYTIGRNIYTYQGITENTIIDVLKVNNKREFYFLPGEMMKPYKKDSK